MKLFWHNENNFGDNLSPIILQHFIAEKVERAKRNDTGKMLSTGSIFGALRENDIVWGTGMIKNGKVKAPRGVKIIAVRGKLTKQNLESVDVPEVYGDPALLLPIIYNPKVEVKYEHGLILHYTDLDNEFVKDFSKHKNRIVINVRDNWQKIIREILSCKGIISSSLHGIVVAEAYNKKVGWIEINKKIVGGNFKFNDYFSGTERGIEEPAEIGQTIKILPKIENLKKIQYRLLSNLYDKI